MIESGKEVGKTTSSGIERTWSKLVVDGEGTCCRSGRGAGSGEGLGGLVGGSGSMCGGCRPKKAWDSSVRVGASILPNVGVD